MEGHDEDQQSSDLAAPQVSEGNSFSISPLFNFSVAPPSDATTVFDILERNTSSPAVAAVAGPSGYLPPQPWPAPLQEPTAEPAPPTAAADQPYEPWNTSDSEVDIETAGGHSPITVAPGLCVHHTSESISYYTYKDTDPGWSSLIFSNVSDPSILIFRAIRDFDFDLTLQLARLLPDFNVTEQESLEGLLHVVVLMDAPFLIAKLIGMGANTNQLNGRKRSPLHLAVIYTRRVCMVELLEGGADTNVADEDGNTAIFFATGQSTIKWLSWFRANLAHVNNCGETPVHFLVRNKRTDAAVGIIVNQNFSQHLLDQDHSGASLLHVATNCGNNAIVQLLLDMANEKEQMCAVKDHLGRTPLFMAILAKQLPAFNMLVLSSDVFIKDRKDNTTLHAMAEVDFVAAFNSLSSVWSRGDQINAKGETAAMTAARTNAHRFLRRASRLGRVSFEALNPNGEHVLNIAINHGNIAATRVLLAEGPTNIINKQDGNGATAVLFAIEAASSGGNPQLIADFIQAGADLNIMARNGVSGKNMLEHPSSHSLHLRITSLLSLTQQQQQQQQ